MRRKRCSAVPQRSTSLLEFAADRASAAGCGGKHSRRFRQCRYAACSKNLERHL